LLAESVSSGHGSPCCRTGQLQRQQRAVVVSRQFVAHETERNRVDKSLLLFGFNKENPMMRVLVTGRTTRKSKEWANRSIVCFLCLTTACADVSSAHVFKIIGSMLKITGKPDQNPVRVHGIEHVGGG